MTVNVASVLPLLLLLASACSAGGQESAPAVDAAGTMDAAPTLKDAAAPFDATSMRDARTSDARSAPEDAATISDARSAHDAALSGDADAALDASAQLTDAGADAGPPELFDLSATTTTSATGFPTAWFGMPLPSGPLSYAGLTGDVAVTNSSDVYAEVLFIVGYLPSGACTKGLWPSTTPEFGPPGISLLTNLIVKAPTKGTFTVPVDFTLPETTPISNCLLIGLNGGTVSSAHPVTSTSTLQLRATKSSGGARIIGVGGEFCFGQNWGCQGATTDDTKSFAIVRDISKATTITAMFGDVSDSTFDGTSSFGSPPAGAWTAMNDVYVYHGAECTALGATKGIAGPGDFYASIPSDATPLLSLPLSGTKIGVAAQSVYHPLSVPVAVGDCLVTLWGIKGGGGFDNETQLFALASP